jgi:hypothetical protein
MDTFDTTYRDCLARLETVDLAEKASALRLQMVSEEIVIPYFGRPHYVSKFGVLGPDGKAPTPAIGVLLLEYVLHNETIHPVDSRKISFRDVAGAGPLVSSFTGNTNHLIAQTFARRLPDLAAACRNINGQSAGDDISADLFMKFLALPELWLYLTFNDQDEDFPAQCHLLFDRTAEKYLAIKSIFVLGTSLAGSLIKFLQEWK